jgi:hypothetical protein
VNARRLKKLLRGCNVVLHVASWLVPHRQRVEWLREWQGEIWHWAHFLVESDRLNARTEQELLGHCWGSFVDALWHRFNRVVVLDFAHSYPLTPRFCLLAILLAVFALLAASPVSLSSWILSPTAYVDSSHLLTVSLSAKSHWLRPELLREAAGRWARNNSLVAKAETYAWRPSVVRGPAGRESVLFARVTPGIFELLGSHPLLGRTFESTDASCTDCVVLSNTVWKSQFHGNSQVIGRSLSLDSHQVKIVGVLPAQFRFPGLDIGLYGPFGTVSDPSLLSFEWPGALVRLPAGVESTEAKRQLVAYVNHTGGLSSNIVLEVLSLRDIQYQFFESCADVTALALLLLILLNRQTVVLLLTTGPRRTVGESCRWWLFFAVKNSLLLLLVLAASVDLVQTVVLRYLNAQEYASGSVIWLFLVGLTVALTWSIRDQLSRCRTCLSRLRTQVDLGNSVGTFCEPSGVELVCNGGHGILHLPVMQFSCVDSERGTDLDESWRAVSEPQASVAAY